MSGGILHIVYCRSSPLILCHCLAYFHQSTYIVPNNLSSSSLSRSLYKNLDPLNPTSSIMDHPNCNRFRMWFWFQIHNCLRCFLSFQAAAIQDLTFLGMWSRVPPSSVFLLLLHLLQVQAVDPPYIRFTTMFVKFPK